MYRVGSKPSQEKAEEEPGLPPTVLAGYWLRAIAERGVRPAPFGAPPPPGPLPELLLGGLLRFVQSVSVVSSRLTRTHVRFGIRGVSVLTQSMVWRGQSTVTIPWHDVESVEVAPTELVFRVKQAGQSRLITSPQNAGWQSQVRVGIIVAPSET